MKQQMEEIHNQLTTLTAAVNPEKEQVSKNNNFVIIRRQFEEIISVIIKYHIILQTFKNIILLYKNVFINFRTFRRNPGGTVLVAPSGLKTQFLERNRKTYKRENLQKENKIK